LRFNDSAGGDPVRRCFYDSCFFPFPRIIMFGRFMPTEGKFFEYFNQHAECAVKAAHALK
jgi:hypothetical protein